METPHILLHGSTLSFRFCGHIQLAIRNIDHHIWVQIAVHSGGGGGGKDGGDGGVGGGRRGGSSALGILQILGRFIILCKVRSYVSLGLLLAW